MKRSFIALAAFAAVASALCQESYRVAKEHTLLGRATISQKITPSGGKYTQMAMKLKKGGDLIEVRTETTLDATGTPLRQVETVTPDGKPPSIQYVVDYDGSGARVVTREHATDVPALPDVSRANPSELWFLKLKPNLGESCRYQVFSPEKMEWETGETTFVADSPGRHQIRTVIGARTVNCIVGDDGYIIRLTDSTGFRLVRDH